MSALRVAIADDEAAARRALMRALDDIDDIDVVGHASTGIEALDLVKEHAPDLLFLDISMPGMNGLDVSRSLRGMQGPAVVFVTAHDNHAIEAFDLAALDYIVKPVDPARVAESVRRMRERGAPRIEELSAQPSTADTTTEPTLFRIAGRMQAIQPDAVRYLEAAGNYVRVHTQESSHLTRGTLAEIGKQLGDPVMRIHRSFSVRVSEIAEIRRPDGNDPTAFLRGGTEVPIGRTFWPELRRRLEQR